MAIKLDDVLNGTTSSEILMISSIYPLSTFLLLILNGWWFLEFVVLLVIPQLLVTSASHLVSKILTTILVVAIALTVFTVVRQRRDRRPFAQTEPTTTTPSATSTKHRLAFLSWARGSLALLTGVSILAVDFVHFPARLSKCYVHGVSLMDSGAGLVVFFSAWTSAAARPMKTPPSNTQQLNSSIKTFLYKGVPLLALAMIRLIMVKYFGHQQPLSEYGVHWNFFLTLFAVHSFSTIAFEILPLVLPWRSRLSGAALLGLAMYATLGHELLTLQYLGARRWVIYGSSAHRPGPVGSNERAAAALEDLERSHRDDLLGANREGLVSAIGYCLVHLFGVGIGRLVHDAALDSSPATTPSQPQPSHSSSSSAPQPQRPPTYSTLRVSFLSTLMALGVAAFFTYSAIESFGEEFSASRRVSNSAFVFWIVAVGLIIVSGLFLVQVVFERFPALLPSGDGVQSTQRLATCPRLLHVASEHSLLHFLVANLLTGLVNLLLKRLVSPNASSRATALERLAWLNAHSEREYLALLTGPATGREWLYDSVLIALVLGVHSFLCIVSVLSVAALRRSFYSSNRLKSQ